MSNLSIFLGFPIGAMGFLFLFWRRLKEDYPVGEIFSAGLTTSLGILIGFLLGLMFLHVFHTIGSLFRVEGLWFWLAFLFGCGSFTLGLYRFKLRFFESLEAAVLGFLFWFEVILILNLSILSVLVLILVVVFFFLDSRYRKFSWYKSGKIGFSGLATSGIFFSVRAILALINPNMISFVGKTDAIVSTISAFIFFIALYNLSDN